MAVLPTTTVDYTDVDFDSLRTRLYRLIAAVFPEWTDQNVASFGNILLELYAFVGDVLGYYLDNAGRESRITQATQRKSLIGLAKLLNYVPSGASAATVDVTIVAGAVPVGDITIPAGSVVRTLGASPVKFQTLAAAEILAGTDPPEVVVSVEHSESHSEVFPATGFANQAITLSRTPYLDASTSITAGNGAYTQVASLLGSTASDRHYVVVVNQFDKAEVRFGNGINGQVPTGTITAAYKTGGGKIGNVDPGAIKRVDGAFVDSLSNAVSLSATNALAATGGDERETIEHIRQHAPYSLTALTRTVSRTDFEANAERVAGVARALMLTRDEWSAIPENQGRLYIVPSGGGTASAPLLASVLEQITVNYPHTITFKPAVFSAVYLTVDVQVRVIFTKGANKSQTAARVRASLETFMQVTDSDGTKNMNVDFGYYYQDSAGLPTSELPYSDIYNAVRDTTGIRKVADGISSLLLNDSPQDVPIALNEFPVLGTVTVIDAETGLAVT